MPNLLSRACQCRANPGDKKVKLVTIHSKNMMTDPIADMLTRIRNASVTKKAEIVLPYSKLKFAIAKILEAEGYVLSVEKVRAKVGAFDELKIALKYDLETRESRITLIKRISTPGRRLYAGYQDIPRVAGDRGISIVSTPKGVMTNKDARKSKLGGEIICEVY